MESAIISSQLSLTRGREKREKYGESAEEEEEEEEGSIPVDGLERGRYVFVDGEREGGMTPFGEIVRVRTTCCADEVPILPRPPLSVNVLEEDEEGEDGDDDEKRVLVEDSLPSSGSFK